jgi:uncharacterized protein YndB with AHSA1/START domain
MQIQTQTQSQPGSTDRIHKQTVLRAPRSRVWQAIADAAQFGTWFGLKTEGPFEAGKTIRATITPTKVDAEVAKEQAAYDGVAFEMRIERVEPERLLSFRWHPYEVDEAEFATAPTTLVVFELEDVPGGVRLTVTESGFDRIPLARRAAAFASNEDGWTKQMKVIEKYLARAT